MIYTMIIISDALILQFWLIYNNYFHGMADCTETDFIEINN